MNRTILSLACLSVLSLGVLAQDKPTAGGAKPAAGAMAVTVPSFVNPMCPYMKKPVKAGASVQSEKGVLGICCAKCKDQVEKDTEAAYKKCYPDTKKHDNKTCPVSGEAIGKTAVKVTFEGHEFSVCCKDCVKPAQQNGDLILTLLTNSKAHDLKNKTCPVSGMPVADNTFCLIGDELVHLSSKDSIDEVKKDPAKVLAKAKELAAKKDEKKND